MWMMGYNDGGSEFNITDSFSGRKLRPLVPRPTMAISPNNNNISPSAPNPSFFSLNHHLATMDNKREFNNGTAPVVVSSRWNPTPEQLRTLEELYRRGTRTPSAEQIQHITAQLRRYGKIEGKNVFYWFQNHKARERQKRRRQMELVPSDHHYNNNNNNVDQITLERKDSGGNRTSYEMEHQTKNNWTTAPTTTLAEDSVSIQRAGAAKLTVSAAECSTRPDGWTQFNEERNRKNFITNERNATWHHHLSPSSYFTSPNKSRALMEFHHNKLLKAHDLNILIMSSTNEDHQTLELFPLRSDGNDQDHNGTVKDPISVSSSIHNDENFTTPYQFFEFLPIKN
ncbi:hypothetical protein ACFE04_010188 [Oxalis oulophora]